MDLMPSRAGHRSRQSVGGRARNPNAHRNRASIGIGKVRNRRDVGWRWFRRAGKRSQALGVNDGDAIEHLRLKPGAQLRIVWQLKISHPDTVVHRL